MPLNYTSVELLGAVEEAGIKFDQLFLRLFFPHLVTFDSEQVMLDKVPVDTPIAPYCSPIIAGKVVKEKGYETRSFTPPYIKSKHKVNPKSAFKRRPGEALGGQLTPAQRCDIIVMNNMELEEKAIAQREEQQAVQAVLTGTINVPASESHPAMLIEMGRKAENNITHVAAARSS